MVKEKRKIIILGIIIIGILVVGFGITYSFYTYNKQGTRISELVTGDIYMYFNETNGLNLVNAMPRDTYDNTNYFEFTIDGKNTTTNKDIWYEIVLSHGDNHETRTERIRDDLLKFRLVEVVNNQETELVNDVSFNDLTNQKIWVDTINRNVTEEITKTYRLYMWISDTIRIGNKASADYSIQIWNNEVYGSIKVNVNGDFTEKVLPYNYLDKKNTITSGVEAGFWPTSINDTRENIIEVNFVNLPQNEINQRYEVATIKGDATDTTKGGQVLAWLEVDNEDPTKYKMYVGSDGITYFPEDCSLMFIRFSNLKTINFENINTSNAINMMAMFLLCSNLTALDLSSFDTSQVTNMQQIFFYCSNLISLNLSSFDTSKVTTMSNMFYNCSSLTGLDLSSFDTSNVTNMIQMFNCCSSLTSLNLSNFDTSNVTEMFEMFNDCNSLTSLDVSNFDTSKVTIMGSMFDGCSSLTSLDVSNFDTKNVTGISSMFSNCSSLTSLDISSFDTKNVTNMSGMFYECSGLTSLDISNFDTSNVTNMNSMFDGCTSLTNLDISNFNLSSSNTTLTTFNSMFYSLPATCQIKLRDTDAQNWLLTASNSHPSSWSTSNVIIKS